MSKKLQPYDIRDRPAVDVLAVGAVNRIIEDLHFVEPNTAPSNQGRHELNFVSADEYARELQDVPTDRLWSGSSVSFDCEAPFNISINHGLDELRVRDGLPSEGTVALSLVSFTDDFSQPDDADTTDDGMHHIVISALVDTQLPIITGIEYFTSSVDDATPYTGLDETTSRLINRTQAFTNIGSVVAGEPFDRACVINTLREFNVDYYVRCSPVYRETVAVQNMLQDPTTYSCISDEVLIPDADSIPVRAHVGYYNVNIDGEDPSLKVDGDDNTGVEVFLTNDASGDVEEIKRLLEYEQRSACNVALGIINRLRHRISEGEVTFSESAIRRCATETNAFLLASLLAGIPPKPENYLLPMNRQYLNLDFDWPRGSSRTATAD